jgi:hypothetical protein
MSCDDHARIGMDKTPTHVLFTPWVLEEERVLRQGTGDGIVNSFIAIC